ncbi:MAG: hypothetical protein KDA85_05935, partial [Planctomycetaceae bacterium]|nr:hypothetical protein [Planctomycetaceae bacterium]
DDGHPHHMQVRMSGPDQHEISRGETFHRWVNDKVERVEPKGEKASGGGHQNAAASRCEQE